MPDFRKHLSAALALPIADRQRSYDFYTRALALEPTGPIADDGLPEPLMLVVNDGLRLVLVPTGGFKWVIGDHDVAGERVVECLLRLEHGSEAEVRETVSRAQDAGATVVSEPQSQPWGFEGQFADPDGHLWVIALTQG